MNDEARDENVVVDGGVFPFERVEIEEDVRNEFDEIFF